MKNVLKFIVMFALTFTLVGCGVSEKSQVEIDKLNSLIDNLPKSPTDNMQEYDYSVGGYQVFESGMLPLMSYTHKGDLIFIEDGEWGSSYIVVMLDEYIFNKSGEVKDNIISGGDVFTREEFYDGTLANKSTAKFKMRSYREDANKEDIKKILGDPLFHTPEGPRMYVIYEGNYKDVDSVDNLKEFMLTPSASAEKEIANSALVKMYRLKDTLQEWLYEIERLSTRGLFNGKPDYEKADEEVISKLAEMYQLDKAAVKEIIIEGQSLIDEYYKDIEELERLRSDNKILSSKTFTYQIVSNAEVEVVCGDMISHCGIMDKKYSLTYDENSIDNYSTQDIPIVGSTDNVIDKYGNYYPIVAVSELTINYDGGGSENLSIMYGYKNLEQFNEGLPTILLYGYDGLEVDSEFLINNYNE